MVGKPRVQCLEDRRVREGTLNFPVLVALSPGTFCWPVSSRPSALDLCPFLLLNSSSAEPGPFLTCYRGHVMGMWWACDGHVKGFWWICDGHMKDMWWAYDGHVMGKLVLLFQSNYDIDICLTFYFLGGGRDGCLGYKKHERKRKTHLPSILRTSSFMLCAGRHYLSGEPPGSPWWFQYTTGIWREDQN